jgi:hypothetical protein
LALLAFGIAFLELLTLRREGIFQRRTEAVSWFMPLNLELDQSLGSAVMKAILVP